LLLSAATLFALTTVPAFADEKATDKAKSGEVVVAQATTTSGGAPSTTPERKVEKVVVTATKRSTTIQEAPISVNAQTQKDIERTGATTLEDVSRNVAGASIQNLGPGHSQVTLRGVSAGQVVRDQPGVKEQVGVYLDESIVSLSLFTPDFDLFDLNRVETLRGPQGTLFGSGSIGGTIRYITNQPDFEAYAGTLEGNVNTLTDGGTGGHVKGMVNMPLSDTMALRLVGFHTEYAGFIDALREGRPITPDVNNGDRSGVRAALAMQLSPNLLVTPRIVYQTLHMNGFNRQEVWNIFANPDTTTRPPVTFDDRQQFLLLDEEFSDETFLGDVTAQWDLGAVALTSVTSILNRSILASRDASALTGSVTISPLGACCGFPTAAALLPSNLRDTTDLEQFTQEVRLASDYDDSPFQWLVGFFYSDVTREYAQRLPTPGYDAVTDAALGAGTSAAVANGIPDPDSPYKADVPYDISQWALFAEGSLDITERLTLTAGARYFDFEESRRFHSGGLFANGDDDTDSTASNGFTPRVIASYDVSDGVKLNLQASQGFRLGGVNDPLNIPICTAADAITFGAFPKKYKDETAWNYEAGIKVARPNFTLGASVYHNAITDLQVSFDAGSCSSRLVGNADAHSTGIELEANWTPTDRLTLTFAGSLLEAEFDETVAVAPGVKEGNRLPSVPEYQLAATGTYSFPLSAFGPGREGFLGATIQHLGSRFTQPGDQEPGAGTFDHNLNPFGGLTGAEITTVNLELDPYTTVNLNAGIDAEEWAVILFINNVADENADLSFNRERGGRARLAFHTNQPRTVGLTVRTAF
jgi:outer membrane receptor protein involved in Fe transport